VEWALGPIVDFQGFDASPCGGVSMPENETVGALSRLKPTSPRIYQFVPTSTAGPSEDGMAIGGAAVPNRSAAWVGVVARTRPARAAAVIFFIGSIPIPAFRSNASNGQDGISPTKLNLDLTLMK